MSDTALLWTLIFVAITVIISAWQRLGLQRDILIATIRTAIQLIAVGYVLQFIFAQEKVLYILVMLIVMIIVAAKNAEKRGRGITGVFWRILITIAFVETVTISLLLLLNMIEPLPRYVIPISGMIIGNGMVVSGLLLNQLKRELEVSRQEIDLYLSLGASPRQAIQNTLRRAVKASMIPTIDGMKTVGLVQLPGMMTGLIIAGASPLEAVKYQILIMYSFSSSAALTSIMLSLLVYPILFNEAWQLAPRIQQQERAK